MNTNYRRGSKNKTLSEKRSPYYRPFTRSILPALALAALIAVSVLPGYSSSHPARSASSRAVNDTHGFTVTPAYDRSRSVTQIVPAGGGIVTATGEDGTRFTLIVPANSLLSAARVTITPVSAIPDLPLSGGLASGVQLEPDGLRLFNFATLVIEPPQTLAPNQETSFAWDQAGDDFHLFPMQTPNSTQRENAKGSGAPLNPRGLIFKLLHFSGYGIGSGTDSDRAAQRQRQPSNSEAVFEQTSEAIIGRERKRQLAITQSETAFDSVSPASDGDDPGYVDGIIQLLKDGYTNDVKPAMDAALGSQDDRELKCAIQKALGWQRQFQLLLGDEDLPGKNGKFFRKAQKAISKFFVSALDIVAGNASKRCSKSHKPEETITLLAIARQQELLGLDGSATFEKAQRCAHFEVEFDSETDLNDPAAIVMTHVHATVPVGLRFINVAGDDIPGQAPLEYFSCRWTPKDPECSATSTTTDSTFRVVAFGIDLNPRTIGDCNQATTDGTVNIVVVVIDPGLPTESITVKCPDDTITLPQVVWSATFGEFHSDEEVGGAGVLSITGWEPGEGALVARKTYSRTGSFDGQYPMNERTTINLWHRPE